MTSEEGFIDYGSGRYKLVGRPGQDDYYFHAGDWLEVQGETGWLAVQVWADLSGRWYFVDGHGSLVAVSLGMRGRGVNEWQSHVSGEDVGERLSRPSKGENGRLRRGERRPVGGGFISRPPYPSAWRWFWSSPSLLNGWGEVAPGGAVEGEDAPVGKGPRRTRPHPGARSKYIAPIEVHRVG